MKKFDVYKENGNAAFIEAVKIRAYKGAPLKTGYRLTMFDTEADNFIYFVACYETRKEAEASLYNKGLDWCKITSNAAGKKVEKHIKLKGEKTMKKNTLYLMEMGMNDNNISTDIKNHRVRVIENIDIVYKGKKYNMFFEFTQGEHWNYRTTNKRTGAQLKKAVKETILKDGIYIDTEFEKPETDSTGRTWFSSWRKSDLEEEFYKEHLEYTKESILKIVNRYKVGAPFTDVCLIETTAADIIRNKIGDFQTEGSSYFTIGETWTEEHKTVRCNKQEWKPCGNGRHLETTDFCEVDLITGEITL